MAEIRDILNSALSMQELNVGAPSRAQKSAGEPQEAPRAEEDTVELSPEAKALADGAAAAQAPEETATVEETDLYTEPVYEPDETEKVDSATEEGAETPRKTVDTYA